MNFLLFVASALISVITANKVIHLDSRNFDTIVDGSRNVFVKFEASWCGPCKRIAPILEQIAREVFPDLDGETVLAAIDADVEREIGDRFEVEAFPTIKLFLKGRPQEDAIDFVGERSPQNIVRFIKENIAANLENLPEELKYAQPNVPLTKILAEFAKIGPKPLNDLVFSSGCFEEKSLLGNQPRGNKQQKHLKLRKEKNRKNKQQRTDKPSNDPLPLVNTDQARQIISSANERPVILIFYSPNCPHCHEFMPLVKKYAQTRPDAIFLRINGDDNISFRDSFKLRYYPSIIGFYASSNGNRYELMTNDRSMDNLNSFINKLIKH